MKEIFSKNPKWDNEQQLVLNSKPNVIIEGGAGSGKTLLSIYLAKELIEKNESNISIVVYTKALRTFIKQTLNYLNLTDVNVYYHEEFKNLHITKHNYIIIDEAQDFSIQDIKRFQKNSLNGLYIFADENQRLYGENFEKEKTLTTIELKEEINFPVINLKHNYRISEKIAVLIKDFYPESYIGSCLMKGIHKPMFIKLNSPIQELEYIKKYITENTNEDIGILLKENKALEKCSFTVNRNSKEITIPGIIETKDFLASTGIEIGYKYFSDDNLIFNNDRNINVMTYHSSKGLQFDTVILPFSNGPFSNFNKSVTYVGMTRSINKLIITYSDIISLEFNKTVDKEKYDGEIRRFESKGDMPIGLQQDLNALSSL